MASISFESIEHPIYKYRLTQAHKHLMHMRNYQRHQRIDIGWIRLEGGLLTLAEGYCWDGASGPALDTMNFARASLVHDAVYQLIAHKLLPKKPWKKFADRELVRIAKDDGMPWWRRQWVYAAVRVGGGANTPYRPA